MVSDINPLEIVARHQTSVPVKLMPIANDLGLSVEMRPMSKIIAGQITRDSRSPSGFLIRINSDDFRNRQRFTFAHEIAHFILHRDLIENGIIDDTMYRSVLGGRYETQANQLAADILMPIRLVKRELQKTNNAADLARIFEVSEQAMKIRLSGMLTPVS